MDRSRRNYSSLIPITPQDYLLSQTTPSPTVSPTEPVPQPETTAPIKPAPQQTIPQTKENSRETYYIPPIPTYDSIRRKNETYLPDWKNVTEQQKEKHEEKWLQKLRQQQAAAENQRIDKMAAGNFLGTHSFSDYEKAKAKINKYNSSGLLNRFYSDETLPDEIRQAKEFVKKYEDAYQRYHGKEGSKEFKKELKNKETAANRQLFDKYTYEDINQRQLNMTQCMFDLSKELYASEIQQAKEKYYGKDTDELLQKIRNEGLQSQNKNNQAGVEKPEERKLMLEQLEKSLQEKGISSIEALKQEVYSNIEGLYAAYAYKAWIEYTLARGVVRQYANVYDEDEQIFNEWLTQGLPSIIQRYTRQLQQTLDEDISRIRAMAGNNSDEDVMPAVQPKSSGLRPQPVIQPAQRPKNKGAIE